MPQPHLLSPPSTLPPEDTELPSFDLWRILSLGERKSNQHQYHRYETDGLRINNSLSDTTSIMTTDDERCYSKHCSSLPPYRITAILVLSILLFAGSITMVNNSQLEYYDKWNVDNGVMAEANASDTNNGSLSNRRIKDFTIRGASDSTATLLTRTSQLSSLLSTLDASDVIECYIVTRMANLANVESYIGGVNGNNRRRSVQSIENDDDAPTTTTTSSMPTGPIPIQKAGLAFRYRPKVASVSHGTATTASSSSSTIDNNDSTSSSDPTKYFELTLEYGPQRTGATKTSEAMPMVHVDMEVMAANYNDEVENNNGSNNFGKYVSWENQGSVYYSTHISNEWSGAYYMAPITGVVLEKILEKAVEYPTKRPRYQPFEVVSIPSNNIILKSSGSDDFVWDMFRDLADLYVDIDPILVPPRGKVQLFVADPIDVMNEGGANSNVGGGGGIRSQEEVKRRRPNPNVKRVEGAIESSKAAVFYENFFNCANAKKTGDYSMFIPVTAPSPVPPLDVELTTTNTTSAESETNEGDDDASDGSSGRRLDGDITNSTNISSTKSKIMVDIEEDLVGDSNVTDSSLLTESENVGDDSETKAAVADNTADLIGSESGNTASSSTIDEEEETEGEEEGDDDYDGAEEDVEPNEVSIDSEDDGDAAKAAEIAAIEAAQKAEAAAAVAATNSSSPEDSAKAASEAAIAAKKAADASVASRAKASAEGLLSGDGATMTSILSSCFSDPKYGIRKNFAEQSTQMTSTYAYIYLDGDVFIRLNLTSPYWGPATVIQTVPPPHAHVEGQGDVVDWAIFLLLMGATVFGFIVMAHQLGFSIDNRLRFRYVFHPLADDDSVELEQLEKGGGNPHTIGIDAIPVSLGGKLSRYEGNHNNGPPTSYKDQLSNSSTGEDESNGLLGIELSNRDNLESLNSPKTASPTSGLPISLRLKEEAPDLVERPSLKSMSKVALPHSSPKVDKRDRTIPSKNKANLPAIPQVI